MRPILLSMLATLILLPFCSKSFGQAECVPSGGLRGIRIEGELMAFTTGIRAVRAGSTSIVQARGERLGNAQFSRDGDKQICSGGLRTTDFRPGGGGGFRGTPSPLTCRLTFEDAGQGIVKVDVQAGATTDVAMEGIYFFIHLPSADYSSGYAQLVGAPSSESASLAATQPSGINRYLDGSAGGLRVTSPHRQLEVSFDSPMPIVVRDDRRQPNADYDVYFPLTAGNLKAGQAIHAAFTIKASGDVDKSAVNVKVDPSQTGGVFDGIGGNFRLQSPADPAHVKYNLDHLRVAWGRVAMPFNLWQPNENDDPVKIADAGKLNEDVGAAMEMARTLSQRNIPMIVSDWLAPDWALLPRSGGRPFGGRKINPKKWDEVCKSIGSYLEYLKGHYGAEPKLFSFNEPNIGIAVLQTPEDHADAIKRLGACFASRGLATKMLLGDTGDPPPVDFINAAMNDPEAVKYVGAVSFHSWRGGTEAQYARWRAAAAKLNVPLLVAEGGTDSDSYAYPAIFLEPWYGLDEISQYVTICRISQPVSILQWQLTKDYSLLSGGVNGAPLEPTQRFWNLKQLDMTPAGSAAVGISCDKPHVAICAYLDGGRQTYTLHLVNNGATRVANISGLPANVTRLRAYVTDAWRAMKEMQPVDVSDGAARLTLDCQSFTTLMGGP
ncbi:MAG: hypothetical protein ABSD28_03975 [Tepidisphaeraceae bacterium]